VETCYGDDEIVLALASLLHDIGKITVRYDPSETHAVHGSRKIKKISQSSVFPALMDRVSSLVKYHHNRVDDPKIELDEKGRKLLSLLKYADQASAAHERDDRDYYGELKEPYLQKISAYACIEPDPKHHNRGKATFPVMTMDEFLSQKSTGSSYKSIDQQLEGYLLHSYSGDRVDYVNSVTSALLNCTSFIPSAFYYSEPNTPLFDHLKMTAAISVSKYRSELNSFGDRMILIRCDITGIQEYIFRYYKSEEADERATKRLRGRSFRVRLLTEAITEAIKVTLNLYDFNVIWLNSDSSLIMADYSEENVMKLEALRDDIDAFLLERDRGMYCALEWEAGKYSDIPRVPDSGSDKTDEVSDTAFKKLINRLFDRTNERKRRMFGGALAKRGSAFFLDNGTGTCPTCGLLSADSGGKCEECLIEEDLGEDLVGAKGIEVRHDLNGAVKYRFGKIELSYSLSRDDDKFHEKAIYINHISKSLPKSWKLMLLGNFVPTRNGRVTSINDSLRIGEESKDDHRGDAEREFFYLGIMKGDVDNLGTVMSEGLSPLTLPKIASFSRNLNELFTIKANRIAEDHDTYLIYSGGDDISALGPIDAVIDFSRDFQKEFTAWESNDEITLSVGIAVTKAKFPLRRGIKIAERHLGESKRAGKVPPISGSRGKNSITVFECTMCWKKFNEMRDFSDELSGYVDKKYVGAGFLHFLLDLDRFNPYDLKRVKGGEVVYYPDYYVSYYLKRNWHQPDVIEMDNLARKIAEKGTFSYIRFPATFVSMLWRKNGENGVIKDVREK
jgi:CRISPR-associated protein Csm1